MDILVQRCTFCAISTRFRPSVSYKHIRPIHISGDAKVQTTRKNYLFPLLATKNIVGSDLFINQSNICFVYPNHNINKLGPTKNH